MYTILFAFIATTYFVINHTCMVFFYQVLFGTPHNTVKYKTIPEDERETAADLKTIWDAEVGFSFNIFMR